MGVFVLNHQMLGEGIEQARFHGERVEERETCSSASHERSIYDKREANEL